MENPKVSVVVPVYNVERYLDNTITHIISQTYQNLEILLVDDGSKDQSGKICDEYAAKDARIRVIHKENGGSSTARNAGIQAATGDYIGFLDADDWADETMYEVLVKTALEHNATICEVMSQDFDEEGKLLKGPRLHTGKVTFIPQKEDFRLLMLHIGDSSFCTKLIRADFCKRFAFPENKLNEDFLLILEMLMECDGVYSIEEPHYNILIRNGSNQRSGFRPLLYDAIIENSDTAYRLMEEHFPDCRTETERFRYVQRLMYLLHIPVEQMTKDNATYGKVISEVRAGKSEWKNNPYLTSREIRNLKILAACPKFSKQVHKIIMKLKSR